MLPYIFIFFITALTMHFSDVNYSKNNKRKAIAYLVLTVIIISLFSGLRSVSVGTDTASYMREYLLAKQRLGDFKGLYIIDNRHNIEFSFLLIEYTMARFKYGFHVMLFVYSFITHVFIACGIASQRKIDEYTMALSWIVYCTLFYSATLNNIRQWVSVAIVYYLFSNINKMKISSIVSSCILACLFHNTGFIIFIMMLAYISCSDSIGLSIRFRLVSIVASFVIPFLMPYITSFIITNVIASNRYSSFVLGQGANSTTQIDKITLAMRLLFGAAYLIYYRNKVHKKATTQLDRFYLYSGLMDLAFAFQYNQLNLRIGHFFAIFELGFWPKGREIFSAGRLNRAIVNVIFVSALMGYWYTKFMLWNHNGTNPYIMMDLFN